MLSLQYNGQELVKWRMVRGWGPYFGRVVLAPYRGKLRAFRAMQQIGNVIVLDLA